MNKNVLITGGSKGIGKNLAINFKNNNYNVIIIYNNSKNDALELEKIGINIYKVDITNYEDTIKVINSIISKFKRIDILINNAGILKNNLFHKMSYDDWSSVINTNLTSIYNVTNPILNNMYENKSGKIINISSIYGLIGSKGQCNYCSSKFGIIGFTKCLALEYGRHNIHTNCICPGLVDTDMINNIDDKVKNKILDKIPVNKIIDPIEIFNICELFINSNNSNGSIVNIDGGMLSG